MSLNLLGKSNSTSSNYKPEIDGLRAIAVISVVLYHAGYFWISGGFIGVDIFFVISGFLITSIIKKELSDSTFSFKSFYIRRAKRILPALFTVLLSSVILALSVMKPLDMVEVLWSILASIFSLSNIFFWKKSGYFEAGSDNAPLLHTWSLSLEEQYYFLFPLILIILTRFFKNNIQWALFLLFLSSLLISQWASEFKPNAGFYFLPSRMWELLVGALLAMGYSYLHELSVKEIYYEIVGFIGLTLICFSILFFSPNTPWPSVATLVPVLGTVMVIVCAKTQTRLSSLLSSNWLVFIGLISYSLYLWHVPVFSFFKYLEFDIQRFRIPLIIVSIILSYLSWKYVETPFRKKEVATRPILIGGAVVSITLFLVFLGLVTSGLEKNYLESASSSEIEKYKTYRKYIGGNLEKEMFDNRDCVFWTKGINDGVRSRFDACSKKYGEAIIVLGDSHAMNIFNALGRNKFSGFLVGLSSGGCRVLNPLCNWAEFENFLISRGHDIKYVIYHQSGSYFLIDDKGRPDSNAIFEGLSGYKFDHEGIAKTKQYLDKISSKVKIFWLGPFAEGRVNLKSVRKFVSQDPQISGRSIEIFNELDRVMLIANNINRTDNLIFVPLNKFLDAKPNTFIVDGCPVFRDLDHLSRCGEDVYGRKLIPYLKLITSAHDR